MNSVVKIIVDYDGETTHDESYHFIIDVAGGRTALCSGEYFDKGDTGCEYEVKKGNITCQHCINLINEIKAIEL